MFLLLQNIWKTTNHSNHTMWYHPQYHKKSWQTEKFEYFFFRLRFIVVRKLDTVIRDCKQQGLPWIRPICWNIEQFVRTVHKNSQQNSLEKSVSVKLQLELATLMKEKSITVVPQAISTRFSEHRWVTGFGQ